MMMNGAKAITLALEREGVEVIFGIPGGASIPLYDAFYDSKMRQILMRHEQAAAHAADGYARVSGKVGVCSATSGPGATNLVTGIASAYMDSSPILALTGQVARFFLGKDAFQEADTVGITMPITKQNFQLTTVEEIPQVIRSAFHIARTGRPGPVHIDIPKDIQTREADIEFPEKVSIPGYRPTCRGHPKQIKKAAEILREAERPILLVGGGVILSQAEKEVYRMANLLGAPVVTSLMGKGAFPEEHPLSLGIIGMHGTKAGNYAINDADVVLAIGCRFSDRTTGAIDCFAPEATLIHIDIDPAEIGKNVPTHLPVVGDAREVLEEILKHLETALKKGKDSPWLEKIREYKKEFETPLESDGVPIHPKQVIKEAMEVLGKEDIAVTEVGQCQIWAGHYLKRSQARTFLTSGGLGTMGFGFPAALGAKVARPEANVVDFAGDGSFLMNCQELATSVMEEIPVVVLLFNNRYLGMVRQWQELFFKRRYSCVDLGTSPDFLRLAEAFGARGVRVERPGEVAPALREAMGAEVTTILDIQIERESNIFPMVPPGKCLKDVVEG
jgi:acetolactate synthase-1/2/3 large subunit